MACRNALLGPDLKAGLALIGGSNVEEVRRTLPRRSRSAMLIVPGWPNWISWLGLFGCLVVSIPACQAGSGLIEQSPTDPEDQREESFQWREATEESFLLLTLQNSFRLTQEKTRRELSGPFWGDYWRSVKGLRGWEDGDDGFTNYVAHPLQGAVSGYIFVQNSPSGRTAYFSSDSRYWGSRLKAMAWAALYSTQFELGPYSEASVGNVGLRPGTMGYVDLVMTPIGGFGWMLAEDALDRYVVRPLEKRTNRGMVRFLRMALSPGRSFANVMRFKKPWRRDDRDYQRSAAITAGQTDLAVGLSLNPKTEQPGQ